MVASNLSDHQDVRRVTEVLCNNKINTKIKNKKKKKQEGEKKKRNTVPLKLSIWLGYQCWVLSTAIVGTLVATFPDPDKRTPLKWIPVGP